MYIVKRVLFIVLAFKVTFYVVMHHDGITSLEGIVVIGYTYRGGRGRVCPRLPTGFIAAANHCVHITSPEFPEQIQMAF